MEIGHAPFLRRMALKLRQLIDVDAANPADGDTLRYDASRGRWATVPLQLDHDHDEQYASASHQHTGSDITSAVAQANDAQMLGGYAWHPGISATISTTTPIGTSWTPLIQITLDRPGTWLVIATLRANVPAGATVQMETYCEGTEIEPSSQASFGNQTGSAAVNTISMPYIRASIPAGASVELRARCTLSAGGYASYSGTKLVAIWLAP